MMQTILRMIDKEISRPASVSSVRTIKNGHAIYGTPRQQLMFHGCGETKIQSNDLGVLGWSLCTQRQGSVVVARQSRPRREPLWAR